MKLANRLADESRKIVREYFRSDFEIVRKEDDSPVTIADRAIEKHLREIIEAERPQDGVLGEEFGTKKGESSLTWVIDPIDGTKSFTVGRPTFGTLIALCEDEVPVLGIIDQGILEERWAGVKGQPTTFNGKAVNCAPAQDLSAVRIGSTTPVMFKHDCSLMARFMDRMVWGLDCYGYGLVASGHMDVIVETLLSPYDFAALVPVVEGAGGMMCDWEGKPLTLQSGDKVVAMGDRALWPELQKLLQ